MRYVLLLERAVVALESIAKSLKDLETAAYHVEARLTEIRNNQGRS